MKIISFDRGKNALFLTMIVLVLFWTFASTDNSTYNVYTTTLTTLYTRTESAMSRSTTFELKLAQSKSATFDIYCDEGEELILEAGGLPPLTGEAFWSHTPYKIYVVIKDSYGNLVDEQKGKDAVTFRFTATQTVYRVTITSNVAPHAFYVALIHLKYVKTTYIATSTSIQVITISETTSPPATTYLTPTTTEMGLETLEAPLETPPPAATPVAAPLTLSQHQYAIYLTAAAVVVAGVLLFYAARSRLAKPSVKPPTEEGVKYCVECGARLRVDARFCDECGAKQE
jgi:hypothetical protein